MRQTAIGIIVWAVILTLAAGAGYAGQHESVPKIVREEVTALPMSADKAELWQSSTGEIKVAQADARYHDRETVAIDYWLQKANEKLYVEYTLPANRPVAERLGFWFKGDGSGSELEVLCYHTLSESWLSLAVISLDGSHWRHLEIAASNPIYLYYDSVTKFRFAITDKDNLFDFGPKQLRMAGMQLLRSVVIDKHFVLRDVPSPLFDTWGGPSEQQLLDSRSAGTNMHMAPIGFFGDGPAEQTAAYAAQAVKWTKAAGMTPGIQFYNHPGKWLDDHQDLIVRNQNGEIQKDGGTFTSPWHPQARALWREHIINSLNYLKKTGSLESIELVELCPGLESEFCYEWSNIWAFDEYAIKAYREYLQAFYQKDIERLNQDWAATYASFDQIMPPSGYYPDREHWVFQDFYRLSLLEYSVFLADAVTEVFTPKYWLWMVHTLPKNPNRYYSARYPIFYTENLRRLGYMDYAQIAALDWQGVEDVRHLQALGGVKVIGEIDVVPTPQRLQWTFEQCEKFGTNGVFVGILEHLSQDGKLTERGELCRRLIRDFVDGPGDGKEENIETSAQN